MIDNPIPVQTYETHLEKGSNDCDAEEIGEWMLLATPQHNGTSYHIDGLVEAVGARHLCRRPVDLLRRYPRRRRRRHDARRLDV